MPVDVPVEASSGLPVNVAADARSSRSSGTSGWDSFASVSAVYAASHRPS